MRRLFNQMIKRPADALVSSIEMLGQSIQGSQRIDAIASRIAHTFSRASGGGRKKKTRAPAAETIDLERARPALKADKNSADAGLSNRGGAPDSGDDLEARAFQVVEEEKEERSGESIDEQEKFSDIDLSGDMLKLVQYRVLFVRRDYEVAFPEREELIADSLDEAAFTSWKIAEFIQSLGRGEIDAPGKWRDKNRPPGETIKDGKLVGLQDEDKKYLRIHYKVLDRFPRKAFGFERKQIKRLKEIRDALRHEPEHVSD